MAVHITTGANDIAAQADAILIQQNIALTGTLTVATAGSTQYGTAAGTVAVITNPTVGSSYRYGGLRTQGKITITASATTDTTVSLISNTQV